MLTYRQHGEKGKVMKVKALTRLMNDYGTKPRIKILGHREGYSVLIYEGNPNNIDNEMADLKVNSFTVLDKGFIEIHTNIKCRPIGPTGRKD